jgi:hypothetical protein
MMPNSAHPNLLQPLGIADYLFNGRAFHNFSRSSGVCRHRPSMTALSATTPARIGIAEASETATARLADAVAVAEVRLKLARQMPPAKMPLARPGHMTAMRTSV